MSIFGRISVDIVYHDVSSDGSSVRVVEMEETESHSTGKVAIVSGTASTGHVTLQINSTGYRNSDGELVSFSNVTRVALAASRQASLKDNSDNTIISSSDNMIAFSQINATSNLKYVPGYTAGTSSYTVFMYGT